MRQPRPEHFQPSYKARQPEEMNLADVMPLKPNPSTELESYPVAPRTRSPEPNARTERSHRSGEAPTTNERPNRTVSPFARTALSELTEGIIEADTRQTERYSFEIYLDQKDGIEALQARYKQRTGKRLSASRIIREALDQYLAEAAKNTP